MSDQAEPSTISLTVVIPWILTLLTAVLGIWQFTAQQSQANRQPFLQKQLELCFQASETAARLASDVDPIEWEKARIAFWELYWGQLSIVEDPVVEDAMHELGLLVPQKALPMSNLRIPSYHLAHAVRDLVLTSWNVHLPPLQWKPQEQEQRLQEQKSFINPKL